MTVKVDGSYESFVAWCDDCPTFSEMSTDKYRALVFAARHEQAFHPESKTAEVRLYQFRAKVEKLVG